MLDDLRAGKVKADAFSAEGRNAYNESVLADYKEHLSPLPPFGKFELVGRTEIGDQTEYHYWVQVGEARWLLEITLDTESGTVDRLQFNPL